MAFLTRDQVKAIVADALQVVADFDPNSDFEGFSLGNFHPYHMSVFLTRLRQILNQTPYHHSNGGISHAAYYDIFFPQSAIDKWKFIADSIDFVTLKHTVNPPPNSFRLSLK